MNKRLVEVWDVLVISAWAGMQYTCDLHYVWPIVIALSCYCMHDRDMELHESVAAMYMLRHTCGAMHSPNDFLCFPVVALACAARFKSYLGAAVLLRRRCVLLSAVLCLALLHRSTDTPWIAVARLVMYVGTTRHAILHHVDPYDCVAQSMWMLCVPVYGLLLSVLQFNDILAIYPGRRRASAVWTVHGIATDTEQV